MTGDFTANGVGRVVLLMLLAMAPVLVAGPKGADADPATPFDTLLGTWGGSGQMRFQDGTKGRIQCDAYYTGGGTQLGMAIRCSSDVQDIEMRSKLSYSGGRVSGSWEERTFNARGTATGTATASKISLAISGGVIGTMVVNFTRSRQDVYISTEGIALEGVTISLSRR